VHKQEEKEENCEKAKKQWEEKSSKRPVLNGKSSQEWFQQEAEWIQRNFVNYPNSCFRKFKVCVRSKRWWTVVISENRKILGSLHGARKKG